MSANQPGPRELELRRMREQRAAREHKDRTVARLRKKIIPAKAPAKAK